MFKIKKLKILFLALFVSLLGALALPLTASAAVDIQCPDGFPTTLNPPFIPYSERCANHQTGDSTGDDIEAQSAYKGDCTNSDLSQDCGVVDYIVLFTRVLSGIVGVVIVIMIAIGGIQFSTSRDNPQAVAAARGRIVNALIALVFYMFSFALLQWLVPGGIL